MAVWAKKLKALLVMVCSLSPTARLPRVCQASLLARQLHQHAQAGKILYALEGVFKTLPVQTMSLAKVMLTYPPYIPCFLLSFFVLFSLPWMATQTLKKGSEMLRESLEVTERHERQMYSSYTQLELMRTSRCSLAPWTPELHQWFFQNFCPLPCS